MSFLVWEKFKLFARYGDSLADIVLISTIICSNQNYFLLGHMGQAQLAPLKILRLMWAKVMIWY